MYYLLGRAIPGRNLFFVPSPVVEIVATENVTATVLQKSMCLEKLEDTLSLLLSVPGSGLAVAEIEICTRRNHKSGQNAHNFCKNGVTTIFQIAIWTVWALFI